MQMVGYRPGDGFVRRILLFMNRKGIAQVLLLRLSETDGVCTGFSQDYANADSIARRFCATSALIEVGEDGNFDTFYCLALCDRIHREMPGCKLLLLCSEDDKRGIANAIAARLDGTIDDFIFYDASVEYLMSKLLST